MSANARPAISVVVSDKYGVRGTSNYSLTLDGHTYRPSISYARGAGYKRFTLTYRVPAALASALHTVSVRVKDLKGKTSTVSWSFTVDTTPPTTTTDARLTYGIVGSVHLFATDNPGGSGVATTYYRLTGGTLNGFLSTGNIVSLLGIRDYTLEYWSVDRLGNVEAPHTVVIAPSKVQHPTPTALSLSCFETGCHTGGTDAGAIHTAVPGRADSGCGICHVTGPKTLQCDTVGCHSASDTSHQSIANPHANHPAITSAGSCTQPTCHGTDIQAIHAPLVGSGLTSSCQTCHADSDATITAAIAAGGATCETCHASTLSPSHSSHESTVSAGTIIINGTPYPNESCASCHSPLELQHLHGENGSGNSCATCHGGANPAGSATSFDCSQAGCHATNSAQPMHATLDANHTVSSSLSCAAVGCHGTDVAAIHASVDTTINGQHVVGCQACHANPMHAATTECSVCHGSGLPADHSSHVPTVTTGDITILGTTYPARACSDCHSPLELQQIHGEVNHNQASCVKCHPDPASSANPGDFSCVQGNCHAGTSTLPMHATVDTAHTLAVAPSCIGALCHTGDTNIVAIHAAVKGRTDGGCGICHGAGALTATPTAVCATAGCHSDTDAFPVSSPHDFTALHAASPASADIQIGTFDSGTHACSECHSPLDLRSLHGGDTGCATCHAPSVSTLLGGTSWNKTCVQSGCHSSSSAAPMHASITSLHTAAIQPTCIGNGCHTGGLNIALIHSVVPNRTDQGCGICHAVGVTPTATCATTGCHGATDAFPYSAPHDLTALHAASPSPGKITIDSVSYGMHACSECHSPLDLRTIHGEDGSKNSCITCHAPNVSTLLGGTSWNKTCVQSGCHSSSSAAPMHANLDAAHTLASAPSCIGDGCHTGGTSVAAIHFALGRTDKGCGICHATGVTPTLDCSVCHGTGLPAGHTSHVPTITAGTITINGNDYTNQQCASCHNPFELQSLHGENGTNNSCVKCHPTPAVTATSFNCSQPACHTTASGNMQVMHANVDASHTVSASLSCAAAGCHGTDVAAIHASVDTTISGTHLVSCQVCHANPQHDPTTDCSVCHGAGLPADHSSHVPTITAGTITINGTDYPNQQCATCHSPYTLQAQHGENGTNNSCVKCHPTPAATATSFNCSQPACHTTASGNMQVFHGNINADHVGIVPGCTATGCHTGGTDVAAIHNAPGGPGCAACHGAGKTPTVNCTNAVGCHAGAFPPATHASHDSTVTTATIAIAGLTTYTYNCSECHVSNDLQVLHTSCAVCHAGSNPAGSLPTGDFDCSQVGCHAVSSSQPMHGTLTTAHDSATAAQCTTGSCHGGGGVTNVAVIHSLVTGRSDHGCGICHSSDPSNVPTLTCTAVGCHAGAFPPSTHTGHDSTVTAAPIAITGLTTYTYNCSECHASTDLQVIHTSCATCHGGANPAGSLPPGDFDCSQAGCHAVSSSQPMHGALTTAHDSATAAQCTTGSCHGGGGVTNVAVIHSLVTGRSDHGCGICHTSDPSNVPTLTCTAVGCHAGAFPPATHGSHDSTVTAASITVTGVGTYTYNCSECHASTDLQVIHTSCATCHGGANPAGSLPPGDFDCSQAGCHAPSSSQPMHAALATTAHVGTLPSGWTCTATGCHAGGTNVAAIHFALGRVDNGCGICHNTTSAPTAACQTAGCHPNGGPVSHASHVSTVTVGTININGTPYTNQACSTCHNTELQAEHAARVAGSGCALCHGGSNPAGSLPAGDYDCSQVGCHAAGSAQPMHPTAALNSAHTVTAPSCTTGVGCHTGGTDIAAIHSTSDVPNKCATCHNATSLATSTCTTSGCHSSGDSTPYAAYSAGSSAVPHPGEVDAHNNYTNGECNNCHDDSNNNCGDCHGDGEYSYLDAPYDIMQSFPGDLPAIHAGVQSTNLSGDWVGGHYTNGCLTCHTPGTTAITDCQTCHDINGMNNDYNWMD